MKRSIPFLLAFLFLLPGVFSQSLTLSDANGPIADGSIVTITGDTNVTIEAHIYVSNFTSAAIDVKVRMIEVSIIPGSVHYFCWGSCYNPPLPSGFVSPSAITINPSTTNMNDFIGDYQPKGNIGTTQIRYEFFNVNDTADKVSVIIHYYGGPVSIDEFNPENIKISDAFPNPATTETKITYELPKEIISARVIVRDLLGNTVKEMLLPDLTGEIVLNTSDLNGGIYFYSLLLNDQVYSTKKLIIRN